MSFGKWIGGALGWSLGGPIGGLVGFAVGSLFDKSSAQVQIGTGMPTRSGDFNMSLVILSAAVMKADGKAMKSELDYVRGFFAQQFGEEAASEYLRVLKDVLEKDIPLQEVCTQIAGFMALPMRLQLLHYLFGIAKADGHVHTKEVETIELIARYMRIPTADYESIRSMFYKEVGGAYTMLEIDASASDDEVKKAYKRMAVRYHPDKVAALGEEIQKGATEKFQSILAAYEQIKKERGLK
jgi:DnaJ like chaperone protein